MIAHRAWVAGLLLLATSAQADDRPYQLVCFEETGITESLDQVQHMQQFLRNDRLLQSGSCGFARIPEGSTARYVGFHENPHGFLFPLYRITYATTGQRMFGVDGVFEAALWRTWQLRGSEISLITPRRCDVLDGFLQLASEAPSYIRVPRICAERVAE